MTQDKQKKPVHPHANEAATGISAEKTDGPMTDGPMTIDDLPAPGTQRWITRRKAEVVAGVRSGLISLEDACKRYSLSVEEFLSWQTTLDRHGLPGLRVTRLQDLRMDRA